MDSFSSNGEIKEGEWRHIVAADTSMGTVPNLRGSRYRDSAIAVREALKNYVNSEAGSVPWQLKHVRRTGRKKSD